jgi:3'-5' exoribonuclease
MGNSRPPTEEVRLHLLHLVASHHGQLEFGSPILPKTPEAALLHFVDNIDARMEMFFSAYQNSNPGPQGVHEWVRPLGVAPVRQLESSRSSGDLGESSDIQDDLLL